MIDVPSHIEELVSYKPAITPGELKRKYDVDRVLKLDANENTRGTAPGALERIRRITDDLRWYPDAQCTEVRGRIARHVGVDQENIIVGNGSESIISYIFNTFFSKDDELLTVNGTFVAIYIWAKAYNIPVNTVPLTDDYGIDPDRLLNNIQSRTKAIYIANPNNPTGDVIDRTQLRTFLQNVPDRVLVIMDEAYFEFARDLHSHYPDTGKWIDRFDNLITLRTFSKAYGMAGMRFGYGIARKELITQLMKLKLTFEPSFVAQEAGMGALEDQSFVGKTLKENREGLQEICETMDRKEFNYVDSYANFVMLSFEDEDRMEAFYKHLIRNGIITSPLRACGLPNCLRITIGTPDEVERVAAVINKM